MTGKLSLVATPIGNLEDITLRALRTLKESDYVLCEDTRVTGKLLAHYDIKTTLRRYDAHTSEGAHAAILSDLEAGKHIALVSDAGTPGVSDPGVFLVSRIRERLSEVQIEVIPGASALTAAFSLSGITGNAFTFLGFVPQKKGRETFFKNLSTFDHPVTFFESVHRIMKTLDALVKYLPKEAKVTIARELTKMHEEVVQGRAEEVLEYFTANPDHVRGEFVVLVEVFPRKDLGKE